MNNKFSFLFAFLALLCLSQELKGAFVPADSYKGGSTVHIQSVSDMALYNKTHPYANLKALNTTVLHILGKRVRGDGELSVIKGQSFFPGTSNSTAYFQNGTNITCIEVNFEGGDRGNVYVVDGGIGRQYISLLTVPTRGGPFAFVVKIFGFS